MSNANDLDRLECDVDRLARALALSPRRIGQLAKEGVIVRAGTPGRFRFRESVRNYLATLEQRAAIKEGKLNVEHQQARLAHERANGVALKNVALREALIPAEDVANGWADIKRRVRAGLGSIPTSLASKFPDLDDAQIAIIQREIDDVLAEMDCFPNGYAP